MLLDDAADAALGRHPWDAPHPIVLDMSAADALGYRPAGDYAQTVAAEIDWLTGAVAASGRIAGMDAAFFGEFFDYAAEDRYLAGPMPGHSAASTA